MVLSIALSSTVLAQWKSEQTPDVWGDKVGPYLATSKLILPFLSTSPLYGDTMSMVVVGCSNYGIRAMIYFLHKLPIQSNYILGDSGQLQ